MNAYMPVSPFALWGCGPLSYEIAEYYLEVCSKETVRPLLTALIDSVGPTPHSDLIQKLFKDFNYEAPSVFLPSSTLYPPSVLVGVGSSAEARHSVYLECRERGFTFPAFIHPSTFVSPTAHISEGVIVMVTPL